MTLAFEPSAVAEPIRRPPFGPAAPEEFVRDGFLGPIRVFSALECRRIARYLGRADHAPPPDWEKARAVRERFLFDLAIRPAVLSRVTAVLGDDVVLWGASAVRRSPGVSHPWHSDIESSAPDGGFLTAWIGIEHTTRESALQLISRSHHVGKTVQEARQARGLARNAMTPERMLVVAREVEPESALTTPDMTDGEALFFDGRLWHGSHNSRRRGDRLALLLQYARADRAVRIPDLSQLEWPFRSRAEPRPAVVVVSGRGYGDVNRVVAPPPPSHTHLPMASTIIQPLDLPVHAAARDWHVSPVFHGPTTTIPEMSCHASVLAPGHSPHPLHAHRDEELLIPLVGEVELLIGAGPSDAVPRAERVGPGAFVYYSAGQHHTIRNPGNSGVAYLMFKWHAPSASSGTAAMSTTVCRYADALAAGGTRPFQPRTVFEGATAYLERLHSHLTTLQPGAGYTPHVDAYDVAILTLSGTVETHGQRVDPLSVIYYAGGESHGMRAVGPAPAQYLVFEFHAPGVDARAVSDPLHVALARRAVRAVKPLIRPLVRHLRGT